MANNSQSRTARRKQQEQLKKNKPSMWKKIWFTLLALILITIITVGIVFTYFIVTAPPLDHSLLSVPASTKVYDMNGDIYADLGTEKRTAVTYDELPDLLIDAVLAAEDVRFFDHSGIDVRRIGGALVANIRGGFGSEGGSTITQQVVKDAFLSTDKTVKRKVQEQWLSLQLERSYEKEEILEMYLNKIYYGAGAYGVATAAETYFGKSDLNELTLPEAALLAGLPQRPSAYDPTVNPELAERRMNIVLNLMVRHEKITEDEAEEARAVSIEDMLNVSSSKAGTPFHAFIDQVRIEVEEKLGADIHGDSLEIYTTLDPNAQQQVEFILSDESPVSFPDDELQSGVAVVDTTSGAIRAIGGGRNREAGGFNMAIQAKRQPGSVIKPIIDYGPAIEYLNWSTYHQINDDAPYEVATTDPIRNWNDQYQGWMTMRYALQWSLNVPAAKTLEEVGLSQAQTFAEGLGIEFGTGENAINIRDSIGGARTDVSSLQIAGAYAAFGNEGIYNEPFAVTKVVFSDGHTEDLKPSPIAAMSDSTAYMITDMLKTVVQSGTGTSAQVSGLPIAGKTGTTTGNVDVWFAGYTTNYTISVWSGYPESNSRSVPDTSISRSIFREIMREISADKDTPDFEMPNSVVRVQVEKGSNPARLPSEFTPESQIVTELFKRGHEPTAESDRFEQLSSVSSLSADFDEDANQIKINWDYDDDNDDVEFEVSYGTNGSANNRSTTENQQFEISNVERGKTYTIEVKVISKQNRNNTSETRSIDIDIPEEEIEELDEPEEVEEPEEIEQPEEPSEPEPEEDNSEELPEDEGNNDSPEDEEVIENDEDEEPDQAA